MLIVGRNAPPARYAVESDSEEDQDPEDYGHAEGSRTVSSSRSREPVVTVDFKREASDLDVIVAVEEAGRAWAEGLDNDKIQEAGSVTVDDRKVRLLVHIGHRCKCYRLTRHAIYTERSQV